MVNNFGKFCRKLRIDNSELLADMANRLEVSSAFLSKVENGNKKPPKEWRNKLISFYDLDEPKIAELDDCLFDAMNTDSIDITQFSTENKNMLLSFARKLETMDESKKQQIKNLWKDN